VDKSALGVHKIVLAVKSDLGLDDGSRVFASSLASSSIMSLPVDDSALGVHEIELVVKSGLGVDDGVSVVASSSAYMRSNLWSSRA